MEQVILPSTGTSPPTPLVLVMETDLNTWLGLAVTNGKAKQPALASCLLPALVVALVLTCLHGGIMAL